MNAAAVLVSSDGVERLTARPVVKPDRCLTPQDRPRRMRIALAEHVEIPEVDLVEGLRVKAHVLLASRVRSEQITAACATSPGHLELE